VQVSHKQSFHAGDVRHDSIKRVSSGVGEGGMAIAFIHQYLALQQQMTESSPAVAAQKEQAKSGRSPN
jgi:thioredoxin reductase (NADPH)